MLVQSHKNQSEYYFFGSHLEFFSPRGPASGLLTRMQYGCRPSSSRTTHPVTSMCCCSYLEGRWDHNTNFQMKTSIKTKLNVLSIGRRQFIPWRFRLTFLHWLTQTSQRARMTCRRSVSSMSLPSCTTSAFDSWTTTAFTLTVVSKWCHVDKKCWNLHKSLSHHWSEVGPFTLNSMVVSWVQFAKTIFWSDEFGEGDN